MPKGRECVQRAGGSRNGGWQFLLCFVLFFNEGRMLQSREGAVLWLGESRWVGVLEGALRI